ncbi:MAG: FAD-dependent oxidoreductase [Oleibacter sp.]|nr:FAD-dependent oxidoreductase [Thalassolituus sp.]
MSNKQQLILAGGGHAHLSVLKALTQTPVTNTKVTLITPSPYQYYSGLLPAWMVGHVTETECRIDLRPLAEAAGVTLVIDQIIAMDADKQVLTIKEGKEITYDWLSLDVGSDIDIEQLQSQNLNLMPVKPLQEFYRQWPSIVSRLNERLAIVGGGAAGVELACAARQRMKQLPKSVEVVLVAGQRGILADHSDGVRKRLMKHMQRVGIRVINTRAVAEGDSLRLSDGTLLQADAVIAASGARALPWLASSGLALSANNFIAVDDTHRSLSHERVFAVGDVCSRQNPSVTRSGVHAVRAGPVLAHNLLALLAASEMASIDLKQYHPRKHSLYLLALGDGRAVVSWGRFSAQGRWAYLWKNHIDRGFIKRHVCG